MDTLQEFEKGPAPRPVFLTVLCILTFIGSGWGLIGSGIAYATANMQAANMANIKRTTSELDSTATKSNGQKMAVDMLKSMGSAYTPENIRKSAIFSAVAAVFCLFGAFMMWNLKKTGFYLYLVGTVIGIISPFIIYGSANFMAIISSIGIGFVGIAFIILYAVNFKHLK